MKALSAISCLAGATTLAGLAIRFPRGIGRFRTRQRFRRLVHGTGVEASWDDCLGLSASHLVVVDFRQVDELHRSGAIALGPCIEPTTIPLEHIADIRLAPQGKAVLLVITLAERSKPRYRIARRFADANAMTEACRDILRRREQRLSDRDQRDFEALVQGVVLQYQWEHQFGFDSAWFYCTQLRLVDEGRRMGAYLPPSRWRLDAIRKLGHGCHDGKGVLSLALEQNGRKLTVCLITPDAASARAICDRLPACPESDSTSFPMA